MLAADGSVVEEDVVAGTPTDSGVGWSSSEPRSGLAASLHESSAEPFDNPGAPTPRISFATRPKWRVRLAILPESRGSIRGDVGRRPLVIATGHVLFTVGRLWRYGMRFS